MLSLACMRKVDRQRLLPSLTALRLFAASYVLLYHLIPVTGSEREQPALWQRLVGAGFTGVSCFFILSGFILAYTHPTVADRWRFYRARFARIYPLYLFAFLFALPNFLLTVLHNGAHFLLWAIPADLLLLQNWFPSIALAVNTPAWTLSCEAFFYLLFPFLVTLPWLRSRHPVRLLALLWLAQLLPPLLVDLWLSPRYPGVAPLLSDLLFLPVFRLGEFIAGMVLGFAFLERQQRHRAETTLGQGSQGLLWASVAVCLGALSLNLRLPHEVMRNGLMVGPFCLLIWMLSTTPSGLLASKPLQLGGEISYGVYLLQSPLSHWLMSLLSRLPWPHHYQRWDLLLVYPFAWLTYLGIEKPCRRWLLGRSATAKPIPTPQPNLP